MRRILKICLRIFIILIVTAACVACGYQSRYLNGIVVTQFEPQVTRSMGYMLETKTGKIVMVDGGLPGDTENVEEAILNKGGVVDTWFITHAHDDHAGVILEVIKNGKVQINNIYVSLNSKEWYAEYQDEIKSEFASNLIDTLYSDEYKDRVHEVALHQEMSVDNLNFKILHVKQPQEKGGNTGNDQSMVIRVSNNFKSMIFFGDLGPVLQDQFLADNAPEDLKADAVQMSHHGNQAVGKKVYEAVMPTICFWPTPEWLWTNKDGTGSWNTLEVRGWMQELEVEEHYVAKDGNVTVRIW